MAVTSRSRRRAAASRRSSPSIATATTCARSRATVIISSRTGRGERSAGHEGGLEDAHSVEAETREMMQKRIATVAVLGLLTAAGACHKQKPPVARPAPPPNNTAQQPAETVPKPPEPVIETPTAVP